MGDLEKVGYNLSLGPDLEDLGRLKTVGGDIEFVDSKVKSLGNLESVGGNLYLAKSQVEDLGNLKHLGGEIVLNDRQKELFKDRLWQKYKGVGAYYLKEDNASSEKEEIF